MKKTLLAFVLLFIFLFIANIGTALAQEFQKSYSLPAGSNISIKNVSGNVKVKGYDGEQFIVKGYKEGRDLDQVEVEDLSDGSRLDLRVRYAANCNCNASIRFEVLAPRSINYNYEKISSVSGDVEISDITGNITAKTASGDINVSRANGRVSAGSASGNVEVSDISGTVSASTASGNVEARINRLEGSENLRFSSASGNVNVRMPANLDATVEMSTATGSLSSDFPLQIEHRQYGPGSRAQGRLGSGARALRISSASGNVRLTSK